MWSIAGLVYSKIVSVSIMTMMLMMLLLLMMMMMMMMMLAAAAAVVVVDVDVDVVDVAIMWADHGGCCPQPLVFFVHQESCHAEVPNTFAEVLNYRVHPPPCPQHILLFLDGKNGWKSCRNFRPNSRGFLWGSSLELHSHGAFFLNMCCPGAINMVELKCCVCLLFSILIILLFFNTH